MTQRVIHPKMARPIYERLPESQRYPFPNPDGTVRIDRLDKQGRRIHVDVELVDGPLFHPGPTVMTTNAERHLQEAGHDPHFVYAQLLVRHLGGDWGTCYAEDFASNDEAVRDGNRIFSVYEVAGETYWLISDASENPRVRPSSTLLLPEDY